MPVLRVPTANLAPLELADCNEMPSQRWVIETDSVGDAALAALDDDFEHF